MKNWKIIAWIIFFFPLGLYYMLTYSGWSKKVTYGITTLYGLFILLSLVSGVIVEVGFLLGISLFVASVALLIKNFFRKENLRNSLTLLVSSILFITVTGMNIEVEDPEVRIAAEAEERRLQEETERIKIEQEKLAQALEAVEKAEEEYSRNYLDVAYELVEEIQNESTNKEVSDQVSELFERLDAVEKTIIAGELLEDFISELELAEETPSRIRLDRIEKQIVEIDEVEEEYITRVERIREQIELEEAQISIAEQKVEEAESNPTWSNHEAAVLAISSLQSNKSALTTKIDTVEEKIIAHEQEAQRKKEEAEKKAAEQAQKAEAEKKAQAEAQRKASEESNATSSSSDKTTSNPSSSSETPAAPSTPSGEEALLNFLNTASHTELQSVSFIGNKRATYIIEYRQANGAFSSPSQVMNVKQIGEGIYSNLREKFNLK